MSIINRSRKPKKTNRIRKIMYWASIYKWDMYMYRKLNIRFVRNTER